MPSAERHWEWKESAALSQGLFSCLLPSEGARGTFPSRSPDGLAHASAALQLLVQEIKALSNGAVDAPPFISSEPADDFCGKLVAVSN